MRRRDYESVLIEKRVLVGDAMYLKRVNVKKKSKRKRRRCTESACEILLPFEDSAPGGLIRTDYFCTVIVGMKVVGRVMDGKGGGSADGGRERRRG